eukprot:scaffold94871_cov32-Tisochrysis_lutea.AAC.1
MRVCGPASSNAARHPAFPVAAAQWAGVWPVSLPRTVEHQVDVRASFEAPARSSRFTTSTWPAAAAQCSAVEPFVAVASTGAPESKSWSTASNDPVALARCKALAPEGCIRAVARSFTEEDSSEEVRWRPSSSVILPKIVRKRVTLPSAAAAKTSLCIPRGGAVDDFAEL